MGQTTVLSDFTSVKEEELKKIKDRRKLAELEDTDAPEKNLIGLALSGGGIRSATFNLGVLQALARCGFLKCIDYLSTVSGGWYIGCSLTWFMSRLKRQKFPFDTSRQSSDGFAEKMLARFRASGCYLTTGNGLTLWALTATIIMGVLINMMVVIPIFFCAIQLLSVKIMKWPPYVDVLTSLIFRLLGLPPGQMKLTAFAWFLFAGMACILLFVVIGVVFSLMSRGTCMSRYTAQRRTNKILGKVLMLGLMFLITGTIPIIHTIIANYFQGWVKMGLSSISVAGIISAFSALIGKKSGNEAKGIRSFLLSIGLTLAVYGILLWIYHLTGKCINPIIYLAAIAVSFILAITADINHVSMHRFYRNRLMETYMPVKLPEGVTIQENTPTGFQKITTEDSDLCLLHKIPQTAAPYHIINANVQTIGSKISKLRERGGDNFIFSPLFCGAESTGYVCTELYIDGQTNLATAMAISGAAIDPNTYATRSRPLSFFMTLLNVRLGYWIQNPLFYNNKTHKAYQPPWRSPSWYSIFVEMFGHGLHEKRANIHLSDGGHFENLGLYELIKRECRCIIVSDATADPDYFFSDLGKAVERVRADFGAEIELNTIPLRPINKNNKISATACVIGDITYKHGNTGKLIYITTTLIKDLPEDIYAYQRKNPSFPDQGTGDQFFDEQQFEAYRELGFQICVRFFKNLVVSDSCVDFIDKVQSLYEETKKAAKERAA